MKEIVEIRWHGRAGQGVVTAAKLLAESALAAGQYFQAFPEYGPERSGAPIQAFTRIGNVPVRIHSSITKPDIVVVMDPTLLAQPPAEGEGAGGFGDIPDVTHGLTEDGIILVNTSQEPAEIRELLHLKGRQIYTVNATHIALETIKRPIPNTPILGALLKIEPIIPIEQFTEILRTSMSKKLKPEVVEGNIQAVRRAFEEIKAETVAVGA